jgi:hypothetical protein
MRKAFFFIALVALVHTASAQGLTIKDYERAVSFLMPNLSNKKVFNLNVQPFWALDSSGVAFITQDKNGRNFNRLDFKKMAIEPLLDKERLAKLLSDSIKQPIKPNDFSFVNGRYVSKEMISFRIFDKQWTLDLNTYQLVRDSSAEQNELESTSPDGKWIAYADQFNLFVKSKETGVVKQLSTAGVKNYEYASYYGWGEIIEGENGERPKHFDVQWSPDSKWIQAFICDLRKGQKMYLLDWSVDTLYRARLLSYYRGSPGDTDMVYMTPVIFNIETGEETVENEFRNVNAASFPMVKATGNHLLRKSFARLSACGSLSSGPK